MIDSVTLRGLIDTLIDEALDTGLGIENAHRRMVNAREALEEYVFANSESNDMDDFDDSMDGDHESGLASAGWGTDEDYEHNLIDDGDY